jgi:glycosyltransferase involved in cell wall biosynthesis
MNQKTPEISVVVATYNGERFLAEQLRSVLDQTFRDFEVVMVDDGSSDQTVAIAETLFQEAGFSGYRILRNESNAGIVAAFERCVKESRGAYIAFCDQDDIWYPEKLMKLLDLIRGGTAKVVYAPSLKIEEDGEPSGILIAPGIDKNPFRRFLVNRARGASMMADAEWIRRKLPFSPNDLHDKWIIFNALAEDKVAYLTEPLDQYRLHEGNVVGDSFHFRSRENLIAKLDRQSGFYSDIMNILEPGNPYRGILSGLRTFHKFLADNLRRRKLFPAAGAYFRYVLKNRLGLRDNLTYFYYLFFR